MFEIPFTVVLVSFPLIKTSLFSNKFENLTNNLADFRLSGRKDFDNFLNENLNFWDLFTDYCPNFGH